MPLPIANLGAIVLATYGKDVVRQRRSAGSYGSDGLAIAGALVTSTIRAAVIPATREQLRKVPEGERTEETVAIYTADVSQVSREGSDLESDRYVDGAKTYRVVDVDDYVTIARYALAIAVRVNP